MNRLEFQYLFPSADKNYFRANIDGQLIYYIDDSFEYISPESSKFWNNIKAVKLLNLPKDAFDRWKKEPPGRKEDFLPGWKYIKQYGKPPPPLGPSRATIKIVENVVDATIDTGAKVLQDVSDVAEDIVEDVKVFISTKSMLGITLLLIAISAIIYKEYQ